MRLAAGAQQQRRQGHRGERARVDEHGQLGAAQRGQHSAERRTGRHPDVARRLDQAVYLGQRVVAGDHRDERELGGLGHGEADPEQGGEHEDRGLGVERQRHRRRDAGLDQRGDQQDAACLEPVDEQPGERGEDHHRRPQRDEQGRDRDARVGHLLQVQRQRHPEDEVPGRAHPDGPDDQAHVGLAQHQGYRGDALKRSRARYHAGFFSPS